ncbi:MAG: hypothetical protein LLF96_13105 [Eubacteriales bacterium]|nr:hypothetical protein [Eubacteriales bacterium]
MFENATATIYDGSFTLCGEAPIDLQPYHQTLSFEDGISVETTHHAFVDGHPSVDESYYLQIGIKLYKIIRINFWDDYTELWLARCARGVPA